MTTPLTSRFSVSTISSTQTASSTSGEDLETNLTAPIPGKRSGPLASLSEIQKRRQGFVAEPGVRLQFVTHRTLAIRATATLVNIPPHDTGPTVQKKSLGLPQQPKALLPGQMSQKAGSPNSPNTTVGGQYGLPTAENRANLKERPAAIPRQNMAPHATQTAGRYGLPTAENRANLKERPVAIPKQDAAPRIGLYSGKQQGVHRQRKLNLENGWVTAKERLEMNG